MVTIKDKITIPRWTYLTINDIITRIESINHHIEEFTIRKETYGEAYLISIRIKGDMADITKLIDKAMEINLISSFQSLEITKPELTGELEYNLRTIIKR